jgi:hypothetical protein
MGTEDSTPELGRGRHSVARVLSLLFAAVATFYFVIWLPLWFVLPVGRWPAVRVAGAALCAIAVARFVWKWQTGASSLRGLGRCVGMGAVATGVLGFFIGFVGPMVFAPGANQGPLLGILITGPVGFVLGALGGGVYWAVRRSRSGGQCH